MAKNKAKNFLTIPFEDVFSNRVYVDLDANVIYDKVKGVAIAYIQMTNTHMVITFVSPEFVDNNFNDINEYLSIYFNSDNVVVKEFAKFYFRISNGYIYLGHPYQDTNYQIRLPRLYNPDDATNTSETGSTEIEEIEEDELDCIDLDEFTTDLDAMVEKSIS